MLSNVPPVTECKAEPPPISVKDAAKSEDVAMRDIGYIIFFII